jgi:Putative restriction endonuclease
MTSFPDWMDLPDGMSAEDYEALPEEICRRIEIVDGAIVVNAAPRRLHQDICRRLANALEAACGPALEVSTDVDLRLRDIPLLNRRPTPCCMTLLFPMTRCSARSTALSWSKSCRPAR